MMMSATCKKIFSPIQIPEKNIWAKKLIFGPEDHWSCIAHLSAEYMFKSAVIEGNKFKNIESD